MADLISRSELLKIIEDEEQGLPIDAEKYHVDKNVVDGMKASLSAIKNIVTEQPTAYDVEKVVEELKELREKKDVFERNINFFNEINVKVRNKALDDFRTKLKERWREDCNCLVSNCGELRCEDCEIEFCRYADCVAEQLKEGGTDE